jgi:hypothetical protein
MGPAARLRASTVIEKHLNTQSLKLLQQLRLTNLLRRFPGRFVGAVFMAITLFATVTMLALMAMALKNSFVFPSLGPTAFLFFFKPDSMAASPRNAVLGHAVGIVCGYVALWLTGLTHAPPETVAGVNCARILAAAFSLAATGAVMVLCNVVHAPAAATTLIISLGFITAPTHLIIIEVAVVVLVVQAILVNRLAGVDFPLWAHLAAEAQKRTG